MLYSSAAPNHTIPHPIAGGAQRSAVGAGSSDCQASVTVMRALWRCKHHWGYAPGHSDPPDPPDPLDPPDSPDPPGPAFAVFASALSTCPPASASDVIKPVI